MSPNSDLLYAAQFAALRPWIETLSESDLARESVLPGWTVADLVSHLAHTGDSIGALQPAPDPHAAAMSVVDYVTRYPAAAADIEQMARDRTTSAADVRAELDAAHERALAAMHAVIGPDRVVLARRGPILLSAFLDTRIVELVVHAGDLGRSVPDLPAPLVLESAQRRVIVVFREVLAARASDPVAALSAASELDPTEFIELATGRTPPAPTTPAALAEVLPLF